MKFLAGLAAILVVGSGFEWAEQASMDLQFEAASVKPAPAGAQRSIYGCHGIDSPPSNQIPLGRCIFRNQSASIIINRTGVSGRFNITLNAAEVSGGDDAAPSIFTALPEQLGLRLEAQKIPFQFIVVDHIDKPQK